MRRLFVVFALLASGACTTASKPAPARTTPEPVTPPPSPAALPSPPPASGREATAEELALVRELMTQTEALRGLSFRAPVRVTIEDRAAMRAYVERAIDDEQLERARKRYLALGVLDPALDVRALLVAMMEEELIGYYDPEQKRLAVRDDIARALERKDERGGRSLMWRATVVHELVHALQDQHFDLAAAIDVKRTTDADNAFGALVEGDATFAMLGYTARLAGESLETLSGDPERVHQLMSRAPDQLTGALRRAPALVREPLLFRYRDGAAFCAELYRVGGWAAIDAAHRAMPTTSQAIRQPQRYVAREPEPSLSLTDLTWVREHGLEPLDEDVLGGLELSVVLAVSDADAVAVVSGWAGDRYVTMARGEELASLWFLRFASASATRLVADSFEKLGDPARRVHREGDALLVARNVPDPLFERAAASLPKSSPRAKPGAPRPRARGPSKAQPPLATSRSEH